MVTQNVFFLGRETQEWYPDIDFSIKANREYDWLSVGEMLDGERSIDTAFLSSINVRVKSRLKRFDCLSIDARLFVSERAKRFFEDLLPQTVSFYQMQVNAKPFFVMVVNTIIDALDRGTSELKFFDHDRSRVMMIRRYRFHKERITDPAIFRIPEHCTRVFITDSVVQAIRSSPLIGFKAFDIENPPPGEYMS